MFKTVIYIAFMVFLTIPALADSCPSLSGFYTRDLPQFKVGENRTLVLHLTQEACDSLTMNTHQKVNGKPVDGEASDDTIFRNSKVCPHCYGHGLSYFYEHADYLDLQYMGWVNEGGNECLFEHARYALTSDGDLKVTFVFDGAGTNESYCSGKGSSDLEWKRVQAP